MGKSQETYSKKEKEKKRLKKRQDKLLKKEERKESSVGGGLENMMAYLDENGNIVDSPPEISKKIEIDPNDIVLGVPTREVDEDEGGDPEGKVAFYNDSKGYGFIKDLRTQESYFFHVNGLIDEVRENDKVTFVLERGPKGMNAVKVKRIS
jgi:cold shock CspA family protein